MKADSSEQFIPCLYLSHVCTMHEVEQRTEYYKAIFCIHCNTNNWWLNLCCNPPNKCFCGVLDLTSWLIFSAFSSVLAGKYLNHDWLLDYLIKLFHLQRKHSINWDDDHEWKVGKDLEGGSYGLFEGTIPSFTGREQGYTTKDLSQNTQQPDWHSNWAPPEYKYGA